MKVLNFGSLNIDCVYHVSHIAAPGETISADKLELFPGGKGLNQSVALARAGSAVYHAGQIGPDGEMLARVCRESSVDIRFLQTVETRTGSAMIQVGEDGQNCIVLFGGANRALSRNYMEEVLSFFEAGDCLVLQNEVNGVDLLIDLAFEKGLTIVLNPSPFNDDIARCALDKVGIFLLNEVESAQITGESDSQKALEALHDRFPRARIVQTLGGEGVCYRDAEQSLFCPACRVEAVDTTAAGDTFTGYFLASLFSGLQIEKALQTASAASALAVSRKGASSSIPLADEVYAARDQWFCKG